MAWPPQIKATKEHGKERGRGRQEVAERELKRRETVSQENKDSDKQEEGENERRVERDPQVSGQREKEPFPPTIVRVCFPEPVNVRGSFCG